MKFDRNTLMGFGILAILLVGYLYFTSKQQNEHRRKKQAQEEVDKLAQKRRADSLAIVNKPKEDSIRRATDSLNKINKAAIFTTTADTTEKTLTAENDLVKITFTNKGGQVKQVELKKYKGPDSTPVKLASTAYDKISYPISTGQAGPNGVVETGDQFFSEGTVTKNGDGSQVVSFKLAAADSAASRAITHEFILKKDDYMVDFNVKIDGVSQWLPQGTMNLSWQYAALQQESDISYEKDQSQISYVKDGSFDYHTIGRKSSKNFDESVKWVGVRQRFFFTILVAKNEFKSGTMEWAIPSDSERTVVRSVAKMQMPVQAGSQTVVPFSIYYGPSEYHILKSYGMKFDKAVNLGQGIYAFVRPINKYVIIPMFDLLKSIAGGMGLAIALLTLFIKLITSPLLYKSYLSSAKMKVLRPEIAKLKEKHGGDQQAMSMEQMKLFREAGVNPLGGCLPALLQIPVFFALFSLFNSDVALRGADFLWSKDLAAYDEVIKFGFHIPLLGDHLSLFNITAVITSFLISIYSMSMNPDQSNPILKYMPYIFPVFLLFFFNRLPSALTWYYTVSNIITLALQYVILNYIIDHDKIMAKIEENRKKPKTKSKWQERLEQMQEQQKKMKDQQQRNKR